MPDDMALLDETCQAPGCYLLNGDHSAEETTACLERWLDYVAELETAS
jgi:hypothetical protein